MKKLLLTLTLALFAVSAFATIYSYTAKDGKIYYVNNKPTGMTTAEKDLFKTVLAGAWDTLTKDKPVAVENRNKVKAIMRADNAPPPPTCGQYETGTPPNCKPIPCPTGFTGNEPNCTPIPPPTSLLPFVDVTKNVTPALGHSGLRLNTTGKQPNNPGDIAFRVFCGISHMNNDDPLVFPNQQGATHHHTYFGNTSVDYRSDLNNLANVGNSTCNGGIMNRSAYWHPSLIENGVPLVPDTTDGKGLIFYYKAGFDGVRAEDIKPMPKGLRILAGNSKAKTAAEMQDTVYSCLKNSAGTNYATGSKSFPNCNVGDSVQMTVSFPRCWDGKNIDSPNHKDHMSTAKGGSCPATHPVPIPQITFNMRWLVTKPNQATTWRLASDNYAHDGTNAGYSGHADYVNGWNEDLLKVLVTKCLNARKDCGGDILGDGRVYY